MLLAQVSQLKSDYSKGGEHTVSLEKKVVDLEERNKQLVDNLNQLAQDQSSASSSHLQQLTKVSTLDIT